MVVLSDESTGDLVTDIDVEGIGMAQIEEGQTIRGFNHAFADLAFSDEFVRRAACGPDDERLGDSEAECNSAAQSGRSDPGTETGSRV